MLSTPRPGREYGNKSVDSCSIWAHLLKYAPWSRYAVRWDRCYAGRVRYISGCVAILGRREEPRMGAGLLLSAGRAGEWGVVR